MKEQLKEALRELTELNDSLEPTDKLSEQAFSLVQTILAISLKLLITELNVTLSGYLTKLLIEVNREDEPSC